MKVSVSLQDKTLKKLDKTRGLIPRSTYIDAILKKSLKKEKKL